MIDLRALARPPFSQFESSSDGFFKMFPDFPRSWIKLLAKITPYLALIGGLANILTLLAWRFHNFSYVLAQLISAILLLAAFSPLKAKKKIGLTYIFWSTVFHGILNLTWELSASTVLSIAVGLYLIQQLRPQFTKK